MAVKTGLINPKVKENWLKRELNNWDWLKEERPKDIRKAVAGIDPAPNFRDVKLWLHQQVCFLIMLYLKRFMLFLDMGGGKTLLTLMLIQYLKDTGQKPKAIIFVPYVITVETWIEETEKHAPDLVCVPLLGSAKENLDALQNSEGDLYVICYQSAVAMLSKKAPAKPGKDGKPSKKKITWTLDGAKVRKQFKSFTLMAMDEVHKCKNQASMTYRMCRAISKEVEWAMGLTGTPFGKEVEDLWAQFYLIDFGDTLGETLGFFRSVFFSQTTNYWGGWEYKFQKKMLPVLKSIIKHRSIRYTIDECHDMPAKSYKVVSIKPNDGIMQYYNKIVSSLETLSFGKRTYREIESQYMKLRQLASGFMTFKGDDASKVEVKFPENPKLDALQELIESMPEDSKMIVFHDFRYTNKLISERLTQMKIPHARVWGGQKNSIEEIRKFKKLSPEKCRVLVINTQAGSSSQNLQCANYVVYYEQPRSAIDREQSERRAWRPGQTKRVFFFDLIMRGTVDEGMKASNEEGADLLKAVLNQRFKIRKLK